METPELTADPLIVVCPHCGTRNRLPIGQAGAPRCGKCREPLTLPAAQQRLTGRRDLTGLAVWGAFGLSVVAAIGAIWVIAHPRLTASGPTQTAQASPAADAPSRGDRQANPAPLPQCLSSPSNGAVLLARVPLQRGDDGHKVEVRNGSDGDAIVKLKNPAADRTLVSFFVARGAAATLEGVPDGTYRIQFGFGDRLDRSCTNFSGSRATQEVPGSEDLVTRRTANEISWVHLTYTLYRIRAAAR
jgi:hypothetical protein